MVEILYCASDGFCVHIAYLLGGEGHGSVVCDKEEIIESAESLGLGHDFSFFFLSATHYLVGIGYHRVTGGNRGICLLEELVGRIGIGGESVVINKLLCIVAVAGGTEPHVGSAFGHAQEVIDAVELCGER